MPLTITSDDVNLIWSRTVSRPQPVGPVSALQELADAKTNTIAIQAKLVAMDAKLDQILTAFNTQAALINLVGTIQHNEAVENRDQILAAIADSGSQARITGDYQATITPAE